MYKSPQTTCTNHLFLEELSDLLYSLNISFSSQPAMLGQRKSIQTPNPVQDQVHQKIGCVITFIHEHLSEDMNLAQLAEEVNMSKFQLIRGFKQSEGITPWKYLIKKRVEKVKKLLSKGCPIARAAVEAGFYDQSHLTKVFQNETGMPPKEYQEKYFLNRN